MTRSSPRFYIDARLAAGPLDLPDGAARHVQVRRLQPGDALVLFDGRGGEWDATVARMARTGVTVTVDAHRAVERELPVAVTLAVAMPANERMDTLVEKATELGVVALRPLMTERSVLRLDGERARRRQAHWQAIAEAAAEQSGRTRVPVVHAPVALRDAWTALTGAPAARWMLHFDDDASAPAAPAGGAGCALVVLSGPEGGLSADEARAARDHGFAPVTLGPRVLRADTAPMAALAWLAVDALRDNAQNPPAP